MISVRQVPHGTQRLRGQSVAAPLGGWNARDALGDMDPLDAITLENWWPGTSSVIRRYGYTQHVTGITGQVESLMAYASGTANTLFAAATTKIYDVTTAGAVGAAVLTGLTNARWEYSNFTTAAGSYLVMVNGADVQQIWDGSAWHKDGDGAPYNITGVNSNTFTNVVNFKNRLWYCQSGTLKAWYLGANAIGGAASSLDMSSLCQKGGYLMAAMTWTLDAGYGVDDYLAFITSKGEILVWRLTDPTSPTGIALIGVYQIGSPIGRRCWVKYAGDLLIITQDGVVPMSGAIQSSRLNPRVSLTNKIQFAMSTAISSYGSNFGWQLLNFPKENQLYLNVPVNEGSMQQQYVQNNITKAWCNFTGWAANCWELFNDEPYFGGNGFVGHAWNGLSDNNANISAVALQSFQTYGGAVQKLVKLVRFHFLTDAPSVTAFGNVNVDYDVIDSSTPLTTSPVSYGVWDSSTWDYTTWGGAVAPSADWQTPNAPPGFAFAPFLRTASQGTQLQWTATDLMFEPGGVL